MCRVKVGQTFVVTFRAKQSLRLERPLFTCASLCPLRLHQSQITGAINGDRSAVIVLLPLALLLVVTFNEIVVVVVVFGWPGRTDKNVGAYNNLWALKRRRRRRRRRSKKENV